MGREVKRVALDFQWPLRTVWQGFVNPHYAYCHECSECKGTGGSPQARVLADKWYGNAPFSPQERGSAPFEAGHPVIRAIAKRHLEDAPDHYGSGELALDYEAHRLARVFNKSWCHHLNQEDVKALVDGGRLMDFTHTWSPETRWQLKNPPYMPTAEEVNIWSLQGMGHDSINRWTVVEAECKRLGVPLKCARCEGEGSLWESEEAKAAAEAWTPENPHAGEGYQIWETVSEGSPVSPVFETPEALAEWMAHNALGIDAGTSYETWLKFIRGPGWAPSFVGNPEGIVSGVKGLHS